jgi:hypothetical protein
MPLCRDHGTDKQIIFLAFEFIYLEKFLKTKGRCFRRRLKSIYSEYVIFFRMCFPYPLAVLLFQYTQKYMYVLNKNLLFGNRVRLNVEYNYQGKENFLETFTMLRKATDNCVKFDLLSTCPPTLPSRWKKFASTGQRFLVQILLGRGLY